MADPNERPLPKTIGVDDLKARWIRRGFDEQPFTYVVSGELPVYLFLNHAGAYVRDKMLSLSGLYKVADITVRSAFAGSPCQPHVITEDLERCTNFTGMSVPAGTEVTLIGRILYSSASFLVRRDDVERVEAQFASAATPEVPVADQYVFRRQGKRWHYTFGGKSGSCRYGLGLAYIQELLRRPNEQIGAVQLETAVKGEVVDPSLARSRGEEIADERMRSDVGRRHRELAEELHEARENGDQATIERLEDEQCQLAEKAKELYGRRGRPRRMLDEVDKARKRVSEAMTLAYKAIAEDHPELADYLRRYIKLGTSPVYDPPPSEAVDWEF